MDPVRVFRMVKKAKEEPDPEFFPPAGSGISPGRMGPDRSTVRRLVRYVSRLGWRAGLQAARLHLDAGAVRPVRLRPKGPRLWARTGSADIATFEEVFVMRQYELPFADFAPRHILDLGANIGYASVYFAASWPQAEILAVEPAPSNLPLLLKNTAAWPQITCLQAAAWSRSTLVQVANPDDEANAFQVTEAGEAASQAIEAHTVPEFSACLGCEGWDLVKMDVEGAEAGILREHTDWLDQVRVLVVELHDRIVPGCTEALCAALRGRHFRQEIVGNNLAFDFR